MINHKTFDSHIENFILEAEDAAEKSTLLEDLIERDEKIDETHDD